jgi:hypothetical protein
MHGLGSKTWRSWKRHGRRVRRDDVLWGWIFPANAVDPGIVTAHSVARFGVDEELASAALRTRLDEMHDPYLGDDALFDVARPAQGRLSGVIEHNDTYFRRVVVANVDDAVSCVV